jgi:WXG100 family type VII secretion target
MMPTAKADWQAMKAMVMQVEGTAENIQTELNTLRGALEELAPQWQSDAASAFAQTRMIWDDDATKLHQSLVQIAQGLSTTADRYRMADEAAQQSTRSNA